MKKPMTVCAVVLLALGANAAATFRVTPYVQHPAPTAMTLKFLSDANVTATVSWWPQGNEGARASAEVSPRLAEELQYYGDSHAKQYLPEMTPWQYRHRIEGLQPDTVYAYKVELADGASYAKHFRTAPAANRPIRFVCYSDCETEPASNGEAVTWDNYAQDLDTNPSATERKYLVDQTVGYASNICTMVSRQPDFFVIAGDLAQAGSKQTHWDEFWRHNAGALNDPAGSIPILAALGNHEYAGYQDTAGGTVQPGEQGALKFLSYFEFEPNGAAVDADQQQRFHRVDYGPVAMIFIDPNNGPDNEPPEGTKWSWAWEYSHPHPRDTNAQLYEHRIDGGVNKSSRVPQFQEGSAQYRWLEEQLADAQTNKLFTFLVCHQCPFSAGYHGRVSGEKGRGTEDENLSGAPTRCLTNLVFKYGVDGWICGHDEMYEHSQVQGEETLPDGTKRPMTLNVWDVGIGGDGLRGCRITTDPNPYEVFRAHTDSPEVYDNGDWQTGTLVSGGKHYGHLEVNVDQNAEGLWTATLTPVYNFVSKNAQTGALTFERRTYPDEVVVTNLDVKAAPPEPPAGAPVRTWVGGGADAKASTAGNWREGVAPVTGDAVVLDSGAAAMTWDAAMKDVVPASWTQDGYTGTVTFETVFAASGFSCAEIAGDVVLNTGTWKHKANSSGRTNRLYVKCGGDFTLGADATVSAFGLGYGTQLASIYGLAWQDGTQGGSYGGHGGMAKATATYTYGCYYAPEDLGNAGKWMNTLTGGGAIRLDVGGTFTHNGTITANSDSSKCGGHYSGAGGSIFINAAAIEGTGKMTANAAAVDACGAGGRIAIILNGRGEDGAANGFENYDVARLAEAIPLQKATTQGGCGTIYCETADDTPHEGWMILKGNGTDPTENKLYYADPFTYQYTTLHFARLTVTNNTLLRIGAGYTLNLAGTKLETADASGIRNGLAIDGGTLQVAEGEDWDFDYRVRYWNKGVTPPINVLSGGQLLVASPAKTFEFDVTVAGLLQSDYLLAFEKNLTVLSGGEVRQASGASASPTAKLQLHVNGDLTVAEGGRIHADERGYSIGKSPQGTVDNGWGGAHGGYALNTTGVENSKFIPYGSIVNPLTHGSGGSNSNYGKAGGGIILLTVDGTLTVNGSITSNSAKSQYYPGAGGSINLTAGSLAGTGTIAANAGASDNQKSTGAGGRIAVRLTGKDADFSSYTGKFTAYGSCSNYKGGLCGAAGTIYLKTAAQEEAAGTLIIANSPTTTRSTGGSTPLWINADNPTLAFGDVIIGPKAKVTLAANTALTVSGSFSNGCAFVAGAGSTVTLAGLAPAQISGSTTFETLECVTPGKVVTVADGAKITAKTLANFTGEAESPVTLKPAVPGGTWTLDASSGVATFANVDLGGCQSVTALTVQGGTDLGGNSENVKIVNVEPKALTWTGAVSGNWSADGNWSSADGEARAPLAIDTVTIPVTARNPALSSAASCAALAVAEGATLDLADKALTVAGDLTVAGTLSASGAQVISVGGDLAISGAFVRGNSTVALTGAEVQTVTSASPFYGLSVSGVGADFKADVTCLGFTAGGEAEQTIRFAGRLDANVFKVTGDLAAAAVSLLPLADGGAWSLLAYASDVKGVKVKSCDASAGLPVMPAGSADLGGNANWLFTDTRTLWDGTTELAPGADVVVVSGAVATIASDIALGSLELREDAQLTVTAAVPVERNVLVGTRATLLWNRPSTIGGQLVVLDGATLTHSANTSKETNRLVLDVAGGGYLAADGKIDVSEKGYGPGYGPGHGAGNGGSWNAAASHGGWGYKGNQDAMSSYGSFACPTNCGSGGIFTGTPSTYAAGGGVVNLAFGGTFTAYGDILSNGGAGGYYTASGGSIWIKAAALVGSSTISARGGTGRNLDYGAGGRVALWLTGEGEDFSEFSGAVDAYGGFFASEANSSAGTVYRKTAADNGVLTLRNTPNAVREDSMDRTDFPATRICDPEEGEGVSLVVADHATLSLTRDMDVSSLVFEGASPRILLNGHTLRVHCYNPYRKTGYPAGVTVVEDGGEIVWNEPGLMLIVR